MANIKLESKIIEIAAKCVTIDTFTVTNRENNKQMLKIKRNDLNRLIILDKHHICSAFTLQQEQSVYFSGVMQLSTMIL